ncbi:ligand-binding sensor domain-containing protein [Pedobacter insulae]|uniref:Two component regulator propeller n=1 Tax=Pedobacter insulae TaxID=414048 RepID=A0A1I2UM21_9SPHI|nr:two-component regulator propeller domain-containing protein [Pedobacter insulae]SFG78078.1 Two component regulator propeller [Pedobacter insulae]
MKVNVLRYVIFTLIALCFQARTNYAQTLYLPHYTTKEGLPSNNCYFTLQDQKGYIWIATDAGVSRFDGSNFENFSVDDGLPDNQILQLKEDSRGRIWFLALNGQLSYFYNGKIYNTENEPKLKFLNLNAVVVSFFEDSRGRIWFGTNKNIIACWNEKSVLKYVSPNPQKQFINAFIHEDSKSNIWAYSTQGLHVFIERDFVLINDTVLPLSYKTSLNLKNKSMYFLDKGGLNLKTGFTVKKILNISSDLLTNSPGYIYTNEKELWLSNNSGVYILGFDGSSNHILKEIDVNQVIKDRNGNMWFTTKNGIYRLPDRKERLYILNTQDGLSNNIVKSVTKDRKNRLWLGLNNAKIDLVDVNTKDVKHLSIPDKKRYNNIKQFKLDTSRNTMYFASDYGLGKIENIYNFKPSISYLKETNNSVFVVKNFTLDQHKKLALALSSGVVIINNRLDKFEFNALNYKENQDYFKERAYSVYFDQQQNLWFANLNGVSQFGNGIIKKHYVQNSMLSKRINDIKELPNKVFAMATDGYGILLMANQKIIKHITQKDGLNNNIINRLFVKGDYLWAISNNGVNRILFKHNKISMNSFDYANDLLSDDLNDLYIDDYTAYFATNNGLVYFNHNLTSQLKSVPEIYISSITHNKVPLDLSSTNFVFEPDDHNIVFNYSAVDFKTQQLTYRYRLKSDAKWTETKNRRLELSSLEPDTYVFEVSAKSQDNQWSEPAIITFKLEKHFWQTWWFIAILLAIGASLLYIITVNMTKRQKNKEQEQLLLKNKTLMLEQRALQAMMNPHFVFNVMNSIQHFINTSNTSSANRVLTGFAKLIRKNLEICTKSYINLEEEIEYLNLYLSLEKNRFGDKFKYKIAIDPQIDKEESFIPSMLLQPYIENAIWHGIMPKEEGGEVDIHIDLKEEGYLQISIIDDGIGIDNSMFQKKSGHQSKGMDLTQERINLLNKIEAKPIQLSIKQNGQSGTIITITVPLT